MMLDSSFPSSNEGNDQNRDQNLQQAKKNSYSTSQSIPKVKVIVNNYPSSSKNSTAD